MLPLLVALGPVSATAPCGDDGTDEMDEKDGSVEDDDEGNCGNGGDDADGDDKDGNGDGDGDGDGRPDGGDRNGVDDTDDRDDGAVTVETEGEPDLDVTLPDNRVRPGEVVPLEVVIVNDGDLERGSTAFRDIVTTARNVRVTADVEDPLEVETATRSIGALPEGDPRTVPISVRVPRDADPGEYDLDIEMEYRFIEVASPDADDDEVETEDDTDTVTIEVVEEPRFEVEDVSLDAPVGETGELAIELENVGEMDARDVAVTAESRNTRLTFGNGTRETVGVNRWDEDDSVTLRYDAAVAPDAGVRPYVVDLSIRFADEDGIQGSDETLRVAVEPLPEQRFTFHEIESTLRPGERGVVRGIIRNEGPRRAENVVVTLPSEVGPNLFPIQPDDPVGSLDPDENASFELPIEVGTEARGDDRQFTMRIGYRSPDGTPAVDEDSDLRVPLGDQRDTFDVTAVEPSLEAGSSTELVVRVTNRLDEPVTDLEARLFADDPLDSPDDEAFVPSLDPGETTTVTFELSASEGSGEKVHPVSIDFRYDDQRGESQLSETYRVAVPVRRPVERGWLRWPVALFGGLVGVTAGFVLPTHQDLAPLRRRLP